MAERLRGYTLFFEQTFSGHLVRPGSNKRAEVAESTVAEVIIPDFDYLLRRDSCQGPGWFSVPMRMVAGLPPGEERSWYARKRGSRCIFAVNEP